MVESFAGGVGAGDEGEAEGGGLGAEVFQVLGIEGLKEGFEASTVDGGGYGEDEFVACVGGGVAGKFEVVAVECNFGGVGVDEVGDGQFVERGEVGSYFFPAAAGEQGNPDLGGVEVVLDCVGFAGDGRERGFGEGMADELGFDVASAVEGLLEGEDDEHLRDALLDPAEAGMLPRPELRGDEPDDRDARAVEVFGEAEVDVGKVDEDGYVGAVAPDGGDEAAVAGDDVRDVAKDFGDAHDSDVFGADGLLLAFETHFGAAETGEDGGGEMGFELGDEAGAVVVSGGFAGGEEDARVG